jgi:hypothetical protein
VLISSVSYCTVRSPMPCCPIIQNMDWFYYSSFFSWQYLLHMFTTAVYYTCLFHMFTTKRLLHDIFHIRPGISPRLSYQARQRSWRADMGRGLIPGTIWKILCQQSIYLSHILHWIFSSIDFHIAEKIFELTNCKIKSLRELPLFNLQIFLFRVWFQKDIKQCWSVHWR